MSLYNFLFSRSQNFVTVLRPAVMPESADVAIAVIHAILFIVNIVGNSLVCAIIKRNRDMRYADVSYKIIVVLLGAMFYN